MSLETGKDIQIIYGDKVLKGNILETNTVGDNNQITVDLATTPKKEATEKEEWFIIYKSSLNTFMFIKCTLSKMIIEFHDSRLGIDDFTRINDYEQPENAIHNFVYHNYSDDDMINAAIDITEEYYEKVKPDIDD